MQAVSLNEPLSLVEEHEIKLMMRADKRLRYGDAHDVILLRRRTRASGQHLLSSWGR
jgi:hypothetical protein